MMIVIYWKDNRFFVLGKSIKSIDWKETLADEKTPTQISFYKIWKKFNRRWLCLRDLSKNSILLENIYENYDKT